MTKNQKHNQSSNRQSNYFDGNAGPEELTHLQDLIDNLTDKELKTLVKKVGIKFSDPDKEISRRNYELVIVESDREDFYREYKKILKARVKKVPADN